MREIYWGSTRLDTGDGRRLTCQCRVLVRTCLPPLNCESYGVRLTLEETGETAAAADLTVLPDRIAKLADTLLRCGVTPCTLDDVVADWL